MASTGQQHPEQTCGDNITDDETNLDTLPVVQGSDNSSNPQTDQPGNVKEEARELPTLSTDDRSPSDDSREMADNSSNPQTDQRGSVRDDAEESPTQNTDGVPPPDDSDKIADNISTIGNKDDSNSQSVEESVFGAGSVAQGWLLNYCLIEQHFIDMFKTNII